MGNMKSNMAKDQSVLPVFAGSTVQVGDLIYYHDDTGVRYARPFSDSAIEAVATVAGAFVGVALSAGVGDDGDSITVQTGGSWELNVTDGGGLIGEAVEPDISAGALQPIGRNSVTIGATNQIGKIAQSSTKAETFVKITNSVVNLQA